KNKIKQFNTLDLLSNISYYNHHHNMDKYTDNRCDKAFIIPEVLSLMCLKNPCLETSNIELKNFQSELKQIQDTLSRYWTLKSFQQKSHSNLDSANAFEQISNRIAQDETTIRNPGFPEHHLIISNDLYSKFAYE